eukprot:2454104-Amphidinium_carterae.1
MPPAALIEVQEDECKTKTQTLHASQHGKMGGLEHRMPQRYNYAALQESSHVSCSIVWHILAALVLSFAGILVR